MFWRDVSTPSSRQKISWARNQHAAGGSHMNYKACPRRWQHSNNVEHHTLNSLANITREVKSSRRKTQQI
jgi:hypothetical protein